MTITSPMLGVDISATPSANDSGIALGTRVLATDGQEYLYVLAGSAITQYDCVGVDEKYTANPLTKAIADDGWIIGFAQVAFASGDYGWVATKGSNINSRVAGSCAADVTLYTTATAGVLDDTSTSQTNIDGVVCVASNGTTATASVEVIATWPRSTTF